MTLDRFDYVLLPGNVKHLLSAVAETLLVFTDITVTVLVVMKERQTSHHGKYFERILVWSIGRFLMFNALSTTEVISGRECFLWKLCVYNLFFLTDISDHIT